MIDHQKLGPLWALEVIEDVSAGVWELRGSQEDYRLVLQTLAAEILLHLRMTDPSSYEPVVRRGIAALQEAAMRAISLSVPRRTI